MIFSLEAMRAKKGDALLLHFQVDGGERKLIVIDGGPGGVWETQLEPRLEYLRNKRGSPLEIQVLMVSHIDDDHINGVLDLTKKLRDEREARAEPSYKIRNLWHNSFDDVLRNESDEMFEAARDVSQASIAADFSGTTAEMQLGPSLVIQSVPQGRTLRADADLLNLSVNYPFDGLVVASRGTQVDPPWADQLETIVVGPIPERLRKFQDEWDKILKKKGLGQDVTVEAAEFADTNVFNMASISVLVRSAGKEMLLTGDARGDHLLEGMKDADLLDPAEKRHVNILKIPHHGSRKNVTDEFFRRITADHYVVSGNGEHGNPHPDTLRMLFEGRSTDDRVFTIHFTYPLEEFKPYRGKRYPVDDVRALFKAQYRAGRKFELDFADATSVCVDLGDPYDND